VQGGISSYQNVIYSRDDIAEKGPHRAKNDTTAACRGGIVEQLLDTVNSRTQYCVGH